MAKEIITAIMAIFGLMIILAVGVIAYTVIGGNTIIPGVSQQPQRYQQECTVQIKENIIGKDAKIESVDCQQRGKCGILLSLFSAEGSVELWDSQRRLSSKDFKTALLSGKDTVTLTGCTSDSSVSIRLYDEQHNLMDVMQR